MSPRFLLRLPGIERGASLGGGPGKKGEGERELFLSRSPTHTISPRDV